MATNQILKLITLIIFSVGISYTLLKLIIALLLGIMHLLINYGTSLDVFHLITVLFALLFITLYTFITTIKSL